jgi:hypothetical protein
MSYYAELDEVTMSVLRKHFFLKKDKILRYVFYRMSEKEEFLKYVDLKEKNEEILADKEKNKKKPQNSKK